MKERAFDELAVALGRSTSRRRLAAGAAAAAAFATLLGRIEPAQAAAFPRNCRRFVLSGGKKPNKKLDDVDDDVRFQLRRKGSNQWETIFNDNDGGPNHNLKPIPTRLLRFKARVGDEIKITARNKQAGGCSLDAIWLHCRDGGKGKKLTPKVSPPDCDPDDIGVFLKEIVEIEP